MGGIEENLKKYIYTYIILVSLTITINSCEDSENVSLREENSELQIENEKLENDKSDLKEQLERLEEENQQLKEEIEDMEDKIHKLKREKYF